MSALLKQHQIDGAEWLAKRPRALLGDAPRVGKTRTIIEALALAGVSCPLIVCPANARTHWVRELDVMGWSNESFIRSYDEIVRGGASLRGRLLDLGVNALILDECHRVRNSTAKRTQLLLGRSLGFAREMPIVWGASGTPIWKHAGNLWTVLASMFPGVVLKRGLKTYHQFMDRFCVYYIDEWGGYRVTKGKNVEELREILDEVMLRRTLADLGDDVPTLDWSMMLVDAEDIPDEKGLAWVKERVLRGESLEALRDPDMAIFRHLVGDAKVGPLMDQVVDELSGTDEQIVIFAHHHTVLDAIRIALHKAGIRIVQVDGRTPPVMRDLCVDEFQAGRARVFLGQTFACMENLTLSAAHRVIIVEPDYTANVNVQAASRILNPNEEVKRCTVQLVALANSLDERIVAQNVREAVMGSQILEGTSTDVSARTGLSALRTR